MTVPHLIGWNKARHIPMLETNAREMEEHSESECSLLLFPRSMVVLARPFALLFSPLVSPLAFLALEMSSSFLSVASLQGPSHSAPLLYVLLAFWQERSGIFIYDFKLCHTCKKQILNLWVGLKEMMHPKQMAQPYLGERRSFPSSSPRMRCAMGENRGKLLRSTRRGKEGIAVRRWLQRRRRRAVSQVG